MPVAQFGDYPVSCAEEMDALIDRNRKSGWPDLTPINRAYAHLYLETYSTNKVAKELGISCPASKKMLLDPMTASYIAELQEQSKVSSIITRDFINRNYLKLLDYAMGEEEMPMVLPSGVAVMGKKVMVGEAKNILSEMAKSIEYEKDTGTKNAPVSISINFGNLIGDNSQEITVEGDRVE